MSNKTLQEMRKITLRRFDQGLNGYALLAAVKAEAGDTWPDQQIPPFVTRRIVHEVLKQFGANLLP